MQNSPVTLKTLLALIPLLAIGCSLEIREISEPGGDSLTIQRRDLRLPIANRPVVVLGDKGGVDLDGDGVTVAEGDCNDDDKRVFPGQTKFFDEPYTTKAGERSFDYDCSGKSEKEAEMTGACLGAASPEGEICSCSPGWSSDEIPDCGVKEQWSTATTCGPTTSIEKTQGCR